MLLHYPSSAKAKEDYWDLPKGHMEENEEERETVTREVAEETGLKDLRFLDGFREVIRYFFRAGGKTVFKTVVFYLAETQTKEVCISHEHIGYQWLPFEDAFKQLKFQNAKEVLQKANYFPSAKSI